MIKNIMGLSLLLGEIFTLPYPVFCMGVISIILIGVYIHRWWMYKELPKGSKTFYIHYENLKQREFLLKGFWKLGILYQVKGRSPQGIIIVYPKDKIITTGKIYPTLVYDGIDEVSHAELLKPWFEKRFGSRKK